MRAVGLLCLMGMLAGCGVVGQRAAVRLISGITSDGASAYERETDLELVQPGLAANVKLVEALLESDPENPTLLLQAAQGYAGYTYAFVEAKVDAARGRDPQEVARQTQRARQLYQRGLQYGLRLLSQKDAAWLQAMSLDDVAVTRLLGQLDRDAAPALLWTSFCWGGFLNMDRTALENVAALPRFQALVTRLLELDESYFYGMPHVLQAVQYASRAPMLGGDPVRAKHHFDRARAFSQERLLIVSLLEAQYYAVQTQDRALFTTRLQQVLDAPATLFPEQGLLNAVAKQRAALWLQRVDELFL